MLLFTKPGIWLAFWAASAHCWLVCYASPTSNAQVLLGRAALKPFIPQPVLMLGIPVTKVQDFALGLVELHSQGSHRPNPQALSRSLWMASLPSSKWIVPLSLVTSANLLRLHSISPSTSLMKMLNNTGPSTDPWRTSLVTGLHLDVEPLTVNSLEAAIQPVPYPSNSSPIKSISLQFRGKNAGGNISKALTEIQVGDISSPSLIHWCCHSTIKGH